jgi:steroid 5-alpha reductase family enzyme
MPRHAVFPVQTHRHPGDEEQSLRSRGDKYRAYQRTTSVFVPWFPKKA